MADLTLDKKILKQCFQCGKVFPDCQCHFEPFIKSNCDCKAIRNQLAEANDLLREIQKRIENLYLPDDLEEESIAALRHLIRLHFKSLQQPV